jgi:hypothetical protein
MPSRSRPSFSDLPLHPDHPKASAWGLWGPDDELGTLNMLTPELVKSAAAEIQYGEVVALKYDVFCSQPKVLLTGLIEWWIQADH